MRELCIKSHCKQSCLQLSVVFSTSLSFLTLLLNSTLTRDLNLWIRLRYRNQFAEYLYQRPFHLKVVIYIFRHTHNWPTALTHPLKWLPKIQYQWINQLIQVSPEKRPVHACISNSNLFVSTNDKQYCLQRTAETMQKHNNDIRWTCVYSNRKIIATQRVKIHSRPHKYTSFFTHEKKTAKYESSVNTQCFRTNHIF